jgi:SanA protein
MAFNGESCKLESRFFWECALMNLLRGGWAKGAASLRACFPAVRAAAGWARRQRVKLMIAAPVLAAVLLLMGELIVGLAARGRVFAKAAELREAPVALVLGTAPRVGEYWNQFYRYRMQAAAELWRSGKVRGLLLSGDNSRRGYDEPTAMREDLIAMGVPAEVITLDYAGFRTLDSVVRARKVFGLQDVIIVSQAFHCKRAVFLARATGLEAQGFAARDPGEGMARNRVRETLARTAAVLDVWVLGREPRFLGPRESVALRAG